MTPLRQRMTEDMQLAGYSARTQEAYVGAVGQLFAHFKCTPAQLSEEQLREYFLYLANERKVSRPTATIALCGIKFFYQRTLQRDWTTLGLVRPRSEKQLPVVLRREEVHPILEQVHTPVYRACLQTIYSCGLRFREGSHLQITDIDSGRMFLHIHGKGGKDRYVPLGGPDTEVAAGILDHTALAAVAVSRNPPRCQGRRADRSADRLQP